jgi:hypothetical protein
MIVDELAFDLMRHLIIFVGLFIFRFIDEPKGVDLFASSLFVIVFLKRNRIEKERLLLFL